jgi:hypothetical protein
MSVPTEKNIINTVKSLIFPSLVTILAMMIWRDVNELRSDVKSLLAQSNVDKTKIDQLEKQVNILNIAVFKVPKTASNNSNTPSNIAYAQLAVAKPEEIYDIKKHLNIEEHGN